MADIRKWLDKGDLSSSRMPRLLSILIRQARMETPITYGSVALELGVHHRAVHHIAGYIGFTLAAVARKSSWRRRPPPPLHALVVNDVTGLPGGGIDGFMSRTYQDAPTRREKRAILKAVYAEAGQYPHWRELCDLLDIQLDERRLADAVEAARRSRGRGGEGPDHLALKMFVRENPHLVGLRMGSPEGLVEFPLASGDLVDVVFKRRALTLAVEVKPAHAGEGDLLRGVFQCLKYRTVLEAEAGLAGEDTRTSVLLVLGGKATDAVVQTAHRLGIPYLEGVHLR